MPVEQTHSSGSIAEVINTILDKGLSHEARINQQRQAPPDLPSEGKGKKHKKSA